ncbi:D-aminoacyl-tRNA deacylase [Paenalcaligenes sp.]|uniref:D-aminoacyl-tRNA deacylase n=1 Tax=Paenalcaligenes sp. TaxID=1966342 RepID=UPI002617F087|nr:D-aminoacyl-tRNA deacylase [Paenalcaligenes sp.]
MICLVQRVKKAKVMINERLTGEIGAGLLVFACAEPTDTPATIDKMLQKIISLRIFSDIDGKMNQNIGQTGGGLLLVSQFTLAADTRRGNRPSFTQAAPPAQAKALFDLFVTQAKAIHPIVETGQFGADMQVHLINDGPVTIPLHIN